VRLARKARDADPYRAGNPAIDHNAVIVVGGNGGGKVGGRYGDGGFVKEATPEDIRGYDVRTGKQLWTFHVVPRPGEPGHDTWKNEAWKAAGHNGGWAALTTRGKARQWHLPPA